MGQEASKTDADVPEGRIFSAATAAGGEPVDAATTALVMIEYQNEFATEKGKLHDGVKANMKSTNMLENSVKVCAEARRLGMKVIHSPITFKEDMSDNPNKGQGILKGCNDGKLFVEGTWNAKICDAMTPQQGDLIVQGKKGLDAFPGTNLEKLLRENKIRTVALGGFLTNCCVESTMRTAFEKGFNVVTLTDCTATTSEEGYKAATGGTFGFFSTPMKSAEFLAAAKVPKAATTKPDTAA
eukprot:gb/GEZN01007236.1/.p1 GENE.gb/GEZN01007236.1/~~gb/GEZN01007236.1/.p1  ORF type:complete len:241 (-),score=44.16 gb/GEZN01007236.1/:792-1514(-)